MSKGIIPSETKLLEKLQTIHPTQVDDKFYDLIVGVAEEVAVELDNSGNLLKRGSTDRLLVEVCRGYSASTDAKDDYPAEYWRQLILPAYRPRLMKLLGSDHKVVQVLDKLSIKAMTVVLA